MTSAGALIYGLKKLRAKKISLMAPYMKPLTDQVVAYIENEGIEVLDRISFEIPDNLEVGRRDPMQLLDDVKRLNIANADAVVLSACVQMQSLPAIQAAENMLGAPGHLDLGVHRAQHARPPRARAAHPNCGALLS